MLVINSADLIKYIFIAGSYSDKLSGLLTQELICLNNRLYANNHDYRCEVVNLLNKFKEASAYQAIVEVMK